MTRLRVIVAPPWWGTWWMRALMLLAAGTLVALAWRAQRRRAEGERFQALFEHAADAHLLFDDRGLIDCNAAAVALVGAPGRRALLGAHPAMIGGDRAALARYREHEACALRDGAHRFEWRQPRLDGGTVPLAITLTPIRQRGRPLLLAVWHDLSARVAAEEALREARDAADAANRAKSAFLAQMSHELRTPLNAIIGFSRQALKRPGAIEGRERQFVERIADNGMHLLALINSVLDLAKIESGRIDVTLASCDLAALVRETVALVEDGSRSARVALVADVPTHVGPLVTDALQLRQVLINLIGNAVKFTAEGEVRVVVETDAAGRPVAILVRDTGMGIPLARQAAVFEAFEQADTSTARTHGGTGLGLAISRAICHALGATLSLESEVGRGSTFRIDFAERVRLAA